MAYPTGTLPELFARQVVTNLERLDGASPDEDTSVLLQETLTLINKPAGRW